MANPLLSDRNVEFLLREVLDTAPVLALPAFAEHTLETCEMYVRSARKLAREVLYPAYRTMDEQPPTVDEGGQLRAHRLMHAIYPRLVELGTITATRPESVGGASLPTFAATLANVYLMAANLSAYGYIGLTTGAARLLESFGSETLRARFMEKMYAGTWTGTMALTEPQAGSSLTDVQTRARPVEGADHHLVKGAKIFISAGDHDLTENIVHLTLARLEGAPPGIKGVSLFAIPKLREGEGGKLVPNDVHVAGVIHKIGWRGLPSLALNFGEDDDCRGWLVGEPHRGISYMFQMMNEARIMVGLNGVATAAVAYQESLEYARTRVQGRPHGAKNPDAPQVPIIEHADVRRMLLRQKAIVEGGLCLVVEAARLADLAEHATVPAERSRARLLLDLLTPIAKTFPAEKGFESNALALQIHGGYGYTSEYMPEAWLRDQKLNTLHEGTSGIQSMDLLGRKVVAGGGEALRVLVEEIERAVGRAKRAGVPDAWLTRLQGSVTAASEVTMQLGALGLAGDVDAMLRHSFDYMEMLSLVVVAWQWVVQAAAAKEGLARAGVSEPDRELYEGKLAAAQYWIHTELPRVGTLGALCRSGEDSYARAQSAWF
ncbi:MAG TPA: acyl-CoA dehydrogenase [Labilithrix sp.]|nr:acyl-CoA dehydrogenase [Labilithrix sp.]